MSIECTFETYGVEYDDGAVRYGNRPVLGEPLSKSVEAQLLSIRESLESGLLPTGREALAIELGKLALHFWRPDRSQSQWKTLLKDYLEDLSEFPLDHIQEVCKEWRRTKKWWPKVSEFRERLVEKRASRKYDIQRLDNIEAALILAKAKDQQSGKVSRIG